MPRGDATSLPDLLDAAKDAGRYLWARDAGVALGGLAHGSALGGDLAKLQGRSVLLATGDQLTTALAMIELDGVARRLTLVPPDLPAAQRPVVVAAATIDAVVIGADTEHCNNLGAVLRVTCRPLIA